MSRCPSLLLLLLFVTSVICHGPGYFWLVADFHYDPTYETTQESCNEVIQYAGTYGDFECDAPWILAESSIRATAAAGAHPDFIVLAGDHVHHPKETSLNEDKVIEYIQNTTDLVKYYFPNTTVVASLGNHDYYPKSQLPGETNRIYNTSASLWRDWLDTEDAFQTFLKGAYYTRLMAADKLRVVVLNTNLYLPSDAATDGLEDPAGQLAWLRGVLTNAKAAQEKVYIFTHVPLGVKERIENPQWMRKSQNEALHDIFRDYSDVITAIFAGHSHTDSYRLIYDASGAPVSTVFIAPSVTPWRRRMGSGQRGPARNPGVRKVSFNLHTLDLEDVEQYYLDLKQSNLAGSDNWGRLYGFKDLYGLEDLRPASLHGLAAEFSASGSEKFANYYKMNTLMVNHPSVDETCECQCKQEHICAITKVKFDDFDGCKSDITCGAGYVAVSMVTVIISLLHMLIF